MEDRYEPLPPITQLPRWVWGKLSRFAKLTLLALAVVALAVFVVLVALAPAQHRREAKARATAHAAKERDLRADQAPRTASLAAGASDADAAAALAARITRDVRPGAKPALSTDCHRITPRKNDGSLVPVSADMRYFKCFATTGSAESADGKLTSGYSFYASADVVAGKLAWCKLNPRPIADNGIASHAAIGPPCVPEGW